jgi:small ligand-binding sensory domain FIST
LTATSAAALSLHPIAATATGEVAGALLEAVGPGADQVFLFASHHHAGTLEDVVGAVRSILGPVALTTETSDVVICGAQVVDDRPALAALATGRPHGPPTDVPGCRPIGQPMVVTAAEGDLLADLASEPALAVLRRTVDALEPDDRALASRALHLGVVLDERSARFGPADFAVQLIRGSVGGRAIAVDADVAVGTTVQFLVPDPAIGRHELRRAVAGHQASAAVLRPSPDRPEPQRDAELLVDLLGPAVAGVATPGPPAAASVLLFGPPG